MSGRLADYLIRGLEAELPDPAVAAAAPNAAILRLFRADDTGNLFVLDRNIPGWIQVNLPPEGLGNSAPRNVGTTAGTVAAGDDARIVGAFQTASFGATGSALAAAATPAAARTSLELGGAATLNVGTAAGTVAAGDDSRLTGALQSASGTIAVSVSGNAFVTGYYPASASSAACFHRFRTAGGSPSALTDTPAGAHVYSQRSEFYQGGSWQLSSRWRQILLPSVPTGSDAGSRQIFEVCPSGSGSVTELYRWDYETGLSMYGANPVIDRDRVLRNRPWTVTTVPSASVKGAGSQIFVSNAAAGPRPYWSDGSNWRDAVGTLLA